MESLTQKDFDALSASDLADRIDTFLSDSLTVRPEAWNVTAARILKTKTLRALGDREQRNAVLMYYRSHFQLFACERYFAVENRLIHTPNAGARDHWQSPRIQALHGAMRQAAVAGSRIAFECLMEFAHLSFERRLIAGKGSKMKAFRKWLCMPGNPLGWLLFYLMEMFRFDRRHRTPEVHGTSYMAIDALRCVEWPRENSEMLAVNLCLNIWRSVFEALDLRKVSACHLPGGSQWSADDFWRWNELDLNQIWRAFEDSELRDGRR